MARLDLLRGAGSAGVYDVVGIRLRRFLEIRRLGGARGEGQGAAQGEVGIAGEREVQVKAVWRGEGRVLVVLQRP